MNLPQRLNLLENNLLLLSPIRRAELYLLPFMIALLILYNFPKTVDASININKKATVVNVDEFQFMKDMNHFLKQEQLTLMSLKQNNQKYLFTLEGDFKNLMHFVNFCEHYKSVNTIERLLFKSTSDALIKSMTIEFEFEKDVYNTTESSTILSAINRLSNPFESNGKTSRKKLYAIVDDEALIGEQWLKVNDALGELTVEKIDLNQVRLRSKNNEITTLELYDESLK
ncbi:MAG: hypothetical protein ACNI3C_07665 [Candidatus Marinarcus sp.]|uniref:hypothetical protein n=1 Tax=Candidatus Marinarcus sp. TaxID=3100987 RepID=UPI003B0087CC